MACELGRRFMFHHMLDMRIEFLFCIDFIRRLNNHISFDVELRKVEFKILFIAMYALS